jgi:hypothetical protein
MRERILGPAFGALIIAAMQLPCAAADYGGAPAVGAVRTMEKALLRSEIPPVQRDVLSTTVSNVVVSGNYAVCQYNVGESAGYSVYARSGAVWKRISHGGDVPTKESLRKLGVPASSIAVFAAHGGLG